MMMYDNRRFNIGDVVMIRDDLVVGKRYYTGEDKSDIFTSQMRNNLGKEGRIIGVTDVGYKLDIDPIHTYTEEMLEEPRDTLAESDYTFNEDVEKILSESRLDFYNRRINKALDNGDREEFERLVKEMKKYKD